MLSFVYSLLPPIAAVLPSFRPSVRSSYHRSFRCCPPTVLVLQCFFVPSSPHSFLPSDVPSFLPSFLSSLFRPLRPYFHPLLIHSSIGLFRAFFHSLRHSSFPVFPPSFIPACLPFVRPCFIYTFLLFFVIRPVPPFRYASLPSVLSFRFST